MFIPHAVAGEISVRTPSTSTQPEATPMWVAYQVDLTRTDACGCGPGCGTMPSKSQSKAIGCA